MGAPVGAWPDRPRLLLSYAYASKMDAAAFARLGGADVVIDSGAFTALSTGKMIDLDRYMGWLEEHRDWFRFAFALDVIGDHVASARNYDRMRARLGDRVQVVPSWHIGSPWDEFERLCSVTDYVSVGGAVPYYRNRPALMRLLARAHRIARDHGTRLHGLGITGNDHVHALPWSSVDSSSWSISRRRPFVYLGKRDGRLESLRFGNPLPPAHIALVRHYGGEPKPMQTPGFSMASRVGTDLARERQGWAVTAAARSYMWMETVKRAREGSDFRLYLAADPASVDPGPLSAHRMGAPYPTPVVRSAR